MKQHYEPRYQKNRRHNNNNNNNNNNSRGGGGRNQNLAQRALDSNGPDIKIRGTASHICKKYQSLARDSQLTGNRVRAENYLQHADYYYRIVLAAQAQQQAHQQKQKEQSQQHEQQQYDNNDNNNDDNDIATASSGTDFDSASSERQDF